MAGTKLYWMKNHNQYNGGIADVWYSGNLSDLWVEYKFAELPKRDSTTIDLRDVSKRYALSLLQQEWLGKRHTEGRNVGVIVGTPMGGIWLPGKDWDAVWTAARLRAELKTKQQLAEIILNRTMQHS